MAFRQQDSLGYLANRVARVLARSLAEHIEPYGLAPAQFSVLVELAQEDGQSQRELAERLDVEQGTMTRTLQRMVRDGWLRRRAHESDGRAGRWWMTKDARRVLATATELATQVNDEALSRLDARTRPLLLDGLRALLRPSTEQ
jgi:DNA-binding MarR family transcriptional regulator